MQLSSTTLQKIDQLIPRYPVKRSCVLPILHLIQEEKGFISKDAMQWLAQKLDLQPMQIYEVVTFYPMFKQEPLGRTHIKVCRTLSCALKGSHQTCKTFQEGLNCQIGHTHPEGEFTLEFVECLADCANAPVVQINERMLACCTPEKALELCKQLKEPLS